jgi:hypothetical protein
MNEINNGGYIKGKNNDIETKKIGSKDSIRTQLKKEKY